MTEMPKYKKKDFVSDQEVRWCPGCGDYSILAAIQMTMPKIGKKKEDICFVSGIGCSSRFPYYMDTYGLHTIHGRAPGFASGIKCTNPDLSVWLITGDGDGLSIGGNHLIHAIRRNLDINIIIFNNEIYGLTKGQYSPTSQTGLKTKSSPFGSVDNAFNPASLILGAGSTFFARTADTDLKHMQEIFMRAMEHKGTSVIEVLQNCVIFNDKVHDEVTNRKKRDETSVKLSHGEPMIFGAEKDKSVKLRGLTPEISTGTEGAWVHDEKCSAPQAMILAEMTHPELPVPMGVFRAVEAPVYDDVMNAQVEDVKNKLGEGDMNKLLRSGATWDVE